jgi:hypothetical protein
VNDRLDNRSFVLIAGERFRRRSIPTRSPQSPRHVAHGAHQHVRIEEPAERLELWTVSEKCSLQYLSAPSAVPYPFQTRTTMERMGLRQGQRAEAGPKFGPHVCWCRRSGRSGQPPLGVVELENYLHCFASERAAPRRCSRLLTVDRHRRRPSGRGTPVVRRPSSAYPPAPFNSTPSNSNSVAVPGTASSLSRARTSPTLPGSSWKAALSLLNASRLV